MMHQYSALEYVILRQDKRMLKELVSICATEGTLMTFLRSLETMTFDLLPANIKYNLNTARMR